MEKSIEVAIIDDGISNAIIPNLEQGLICNHPCGMELNEYYQQRHNNYINSKCVVYCIWQNILLKLFHVQIGFKK